MSGPEDAGPYPPQPSSAPGRPAVTAGENEVQESNDSKAKVNRSRTKFSPKAKEYLALFSENDVAESDLTDWIEENHPELRSRLDHFLRDARNPSVALRDALIQLAGLHRLTLTRSWFDDHWHPSALIDKFRQLNHGFRSKLESYASAYIKLTPQSLPMTDVKDGKFWRACTIKMAIEADGLARWEIENPQDRKPTRIGYAICHYDSFYLTGFDDVDASNVSLDILSEPTPDLRAHKVILMGLHAGTIFHGQATNTRAVAKRTLLLEPDVWRCEWNSGETIPEPVKEWLMHDSGGIAVDLKHIRPESRQ